MATYKIGKKMVPIAVLLAFTLGVAGCRNSAPQNVKAAALKTMVENAKDDEAMQMVCRGRAEPARAYTYRLASGQKIFRYLVREGEQVRAGQRVFESGSLELMAQSDELKRMKIAMWDRSKRLADLDWQIAELQRTLAARSMKKDQDNGKDAPDADLARMVNAKRRELDLLQEEKKILSAIADEDRRLGVSLDELNGRIKKDMERLGFAAPFAGRVISIPENVEQLLPGETAIEIWDESQVIIQLTVWQNQLRFIALGKVVEVQPDLFDGIRLKGTVLSVGSSPEKRPNNGNPEYSVKISLQDERGVIQPGMTVSVRIDLDKKATK